MKGIIFTEFLKMVEEVFSLEITDRMIDESHLSTKGAYTTIGTYDHHELLEMISHLSNITGISIPDLEIAYGKFLFISFTKHYMNFMVNIKTTFDLLMLINSYIHVEVKKLYPDAELPIFTNKLLDSNHLILEYHSTRPFVDLAHGLILGCADYFGETINIKKENIISDHTQEHIVRFLIEKKE